MVDALCLGMDNLNWKTWAFIGVLALFGLTQIFNHLPGAPTTLSWGTDGGLALPRGEQPYSVKTAPMAADAHRPRLAVLPRVTLAGGLTREQIQAISAKDAPLATDIGTAAAPKDKKKNETCDESHPKLDPVSGKLLPCPKVEETCDPKAPPRIDPKTGKVVPCKKKEELCDPAHPKFDEKTGRPLPCKVKTEKTAAATPVAETPKPTNANDDQAPTSANSTGAGGVFGPNGQVAAGTNLAALAQKAPPDQSLTLADWQKLLLGSPDINSTRRFIQDYQTGIVTASVFYQIANLMLADSRQDMRTLGVLCAGMTPSVTSFTLLANVENTDSASSPVHEDAESYLTQYSTLSYVSILRAVITTTAQTYATLAATERLDTAAQTYLRGITGKSGVVTFTAANQNAKFFRPFVTSLQSLSKSTFPNLGAIAQRTLSDIQGLLTAMNQPATTPTAGATTTVAAAQRTH